MDRGRVMQLCSEFLGLMSEVAPPQHIFCEIFRGGDDEQKSRVRRKARSIALADSMADSTASLVISHGQSNTFRVDGSRAYASVCTADSHVHRMIVTLVLFVLLVVLMFMFMKRTPGV